MCSRNSSCFNALDASGQSVCTQHAWTTCLRSPTRSARRRVREGGSFPHKRFVLAPVQFWIFAPKVLSEKFSPTRSGVRAGRRRTGPLALRSRAPRDVTQRQLAHPYATVAPDVSTPCRIRFMAGGGVDAAERSAASERSAAWACTPLSAQRRPHLPLLIALWLRSTRL